MSAAEIVLSGGTGLIGRRLAELLRAGGHALRLLSRDPRSVATHGGTDRALRWNGTDVDPEWLAGAQAVVHLAGEPVFGGLPTAARRERVWASRVDSTRSLVAALGALEPARRPGVLLCASAVGYYADSGDDEIREGDPPGPGFLAELCRDWEAEAARARELSVRVCSLRIGVVLSRGGGALRTLLPAFRAGLGGRVGDGRQWFPWIHLEDCAALARFALESPLASGPWNCVAPGAVRNAEFSRALAHALHRPALLPLPAFAVRAALREISSELLASRRVVPAAATAAGFAFRFPELAPALADVLAKRRAPAVV
jgi:hypothetical protein